MNGRDTVGLSDAAAARKERIFEAARGALVRRRRRRVVVRAGVAAAAGVAVIAGGVWVAAVARGGGGVAPNVGPAVAGRGEDGAERGGVVAPEVVVGPAPELACEESAQGATGVRVEWITTDAGVLERTLIRNDGPRLVRYIGDDELLEALEGTGERYGIVRAAGRVVVVCRTCRGGTEDGAWWPGVPRWPG